jgi:hypothetical protein
MNCSVTLKEWENAGIVGDESSEDGYLWLRLMTKNKKTI